MPKLYVLVKRRTAKNWRAAIPAKAGVTRAKLKSVIGKSRKKGYSYKIVSETELKRLMQKPKRRKTTRKRTMKRRKKR